MLEQLYERRETRQMAKISPFITQLVVEPSVEEGSPIRLTCLKKVCFGDNFKQFKASDFDVQSIISVGALHLLKPVSMRNSDFQSFADNVDMVADSIDKHLNSNENVQVSPQE